MHAESRFPCLTHSRVIALRAITRVAPVAPISNVPNGAFFNSSADHFVIESVLRSCSECLGGFRGNASDLKERKLNSMQKQIAAALPRIRGSREQQRINLSIMKLDRARINPLAPS